MSSVFVFLMLSIAYIVYFKSDFWKGASSFMETFYLDSCGGGRLHCAVWTPQQQPKAVVQLIHGIAEHIARYDAFAQFLTQHGFVVAADDHMGHGGSVTNGLTGYFSGGWMTAVADEKLLHDHMHTQYPDLPYYILGHSMGSFLLRTYLYTYPDAVDKAIISGTGWEDPIKVKLGLLVCKLAQAHSDETKTSELVTKLLFGSYNKPFAPVTSPNAWICSDEDVVAAYDADPLCGFAPTIGLARDMLSGIQMNEQSDNLAKMPMQLPVMFVSGSQDPVGGMAKGVLRCIDAFKRAGLRDVTIKLYPDGRHEMLNERNKDEVYQDILTWLERDA